MKNRVSTWVAAVVAMLLLMAGTPAAAQELASAIRKIQNQEFDAARTELNQLLEKSSRKPEFYYWMGRAYTEQAEQEEDPTVRNTLLEESKKWFQQGIERNGKYALNYVGLGRYYALNGNIVEAKANLTKAESLDIGDRATVIQLGDAWRQLGAEGRDKATKYLALAETMGAADPEIFTAQGVLWFEQNVEDLPLTYYDKALGVNANYVDALYRKGEYYVKYKKYTEGAEALKKALSIDPNYAPALQLMGELYFKAKQYAIATDYYKQYVALREKTLGGKKDISARYRYAQFLYLKKDYQAAVDEINTVLKETQSNVMLRLLAYSYYELGKIPEAKQALTTYFQKIDPKYTIARDYEYRGKIAMSEGQLAAGEADILKAVEMDETRTDLYQDLVKLYNKAEAFDKSIAIQRKAVERDPSIQNYFALGQVLDFQYVKLRDSCKTANKDCVPHKNPAFTKYLQGADSAYRKMIELRPMFIPAWLYLGRTNAKLDAETEIGLAKPAYEKVIELGTPDPVKNKKELVEAHNYMAFYSINVAKSKTQALDHIQKMLSLDPANEGGKNLKRYIEEVAAPTTTGSR